MDNQHNDLLVLGIWSRNLFRLSLVGGPLFALAFRFYYKVTVESESWVNSLPLCANPLEILNPWGWSRCLRKCWFVPWLFSCHEVLPQLLSMCIRLGDLFLVLVPVPWHVSGHMGSDPHSGYVYQGQQTILLLIQVSWYISDYVWFHQHGDLVN